MTYDAVKDFVPIGITTTNALMATIAGNVPANNLKEFVAYAKANPGKLNFAISGAGSGPHFGAEMFKRAAGLDIPIVFYKGSGPALTDLLGGQVQIHGCSLGHDGPGQGRQAEGDRGDRHGAAREVAPGRPYFRAGRSRRRGRERFPGRARARRHAPRGGGQALAGAERSAGATGP